eukprot:scaffold215085_cov17-Prasinocladus_malaysianus.AAC.1
MFHHRVRVPQTTQTTYVNRTHYPNSEAPNPLHGTGLRINPAKCTWMPPLAGTDSPPDTSTGVPASDLRCIVPPNPVPATSPGLAGSRTTPRPVSVPLPVITDVSAVRPVSALP